MKLLIVTRSTPLHTGSGGMEQVSWDLARALAARGVEVVLWTTPVPGKPAQFEVDGISIVTAGGGRPGRTSLRWWWWSYRRPIQVFDVVLSISAAGASILRRGKRPPVVIQAHGTARAELHAIIQARDRLWLLKAARMAFWSVIDLGSYRRASAVVAIGPAVTAGLDIGANGRALRGVVRDEIRNGVVASSTTTQSSPRDYLVTVARLVRQKGVDTVIAALAESPWTLCIVGDGPERASLESQVERMGMVDRVMFRGNLEATATREMIDCARALIFLPRDMRREGLPTVVLEALAGRTPVVTYPGELWPQDIASQLTFVTATSPADFQTALIRATEGPSPELPVAYSIDHSADRYHTLLCGLIGVA